MPNKIKEEPLVPYGDFLVLCNPSIPELKEAIAIAESFIEQLINTVQADRRTLHTKVTARDDRCGNYEITLGWKVYGQKQEGIEG